MKKDWGYPDWNPGMGEESFHPYPPGPKPPPTPKPPKPPHHPCPQPPGTILRVFIPAGAVINLANLVELRSPSGICLIIRIPLLAGTNNLNLNSIIDTIKQAGGSVEFQ